MKEREAMEALIKSDRMRADGDSDSDDDDDDDDDDDGDDDDDDEEDDSDDSDQERPRKKRRKRKKRRIKDILAADVSSLLTFSGTGGADSEDAPLSSLADASKKSRRRRGPALTEEERERRRNRKVLAKNERVRARWAKKHRAKLHKYRVKSIQNLARGEFERVAELSDVRKAIARKWVFVTGTPSLNHSLTH